MTTTPNDETLKATRIAGQGRLRKALLIELEDALASGHAKPEVTAGTKFSWLIEDYADEYHEGGMRRMTDTHGATLANQLGQLLRGLDLGRVDWTAVARSLLAKATEAHQAETQARAKRQY